jgi:hypothetical protein
MDEKEKEAKRRALRNISANALSPLEEAQFQKWYANWVQELGSQGQRLDPDPDAPEHNYDYRKAFKANIQPELTEHGDYRWSDLGKLSGHVNPHQEIDNEDFEEVFKQRRPY